MASTNSIRGERYTDGSMQLVLDLGRPEYLPSWSKGIISGPGKYPQESRFTWQLGELRRINPGIVDDKVMSGKRRVNYYEDGNPRHERDMK